jgi:glycogen operon protein
MLLAGDETGRTQVGNNNAYCQDNEISWLNWTPDAEDRTLLELVRRWIALRKAHPGFRRQRFFAGRSVADRDIKDIYWLNPDGSEMSDEEWAHSFARCLGICMPGGEISRQDARGRPVTDDDFLMLLNAHHEAIPFQVPAVAGIRHWETLIDTSLDDAAPAERSYAAGETFELQGRAFALLIHTGAAPQD